MATSKSLTVFGLLSLLATYSHAHSHGQNAYVARAWRGTGNFLDKREGIYTYSGCYSSSDGMTFNNQYGYQSNDYCAPICTTAGQSVFGFENGGDCWCGNLLPPASSKVDDSNCDIGCFGYGQDKCGGKGFFSVFLTGTKNTVDSVDSPSSSSSSSSSGTTTTSSITTSQGPAKTVVVTAPASIDSSNSVSSSAASGSKPNTAGIAAGVVVGVVLVGALIAGAIFFMKNKKKKQAEEEYKRTQVSDFMHNRSGGVEQKPPQTGFSTRSDQRLDPEAGARRNSFGSIADDQDYSRKILRVANPDHD